ncbi:MAG TPA: putative toxin-antitoxin system toxin component, PIN family [Candidatus Doudnabacteria bacterium]|nr:putative toxin-antitoxin system toxin component, PIN family [Candidatus Doudnabacteria bacterium]
MKIVIDTNVIVDGIKDDYSYEKQILDAVISGEIEAYANHGTISENKLIMKQLITDPNYQQEINNLFAQINMVRNRRQINIVRDPEDNKILESAVESKADYLVTRDNDLLSLDSFQGIKIVTPAEFWNTYKDTGSDLWKQWAGFFSGK